MPSSRWDDEDEKYPRITKKFLQKVCKDNSLYSTPHLNDTLYLHFKGLTKIENLEEYTGLRSLWLENNGIRKIENLDQQVELRCLYLQENLVTDIENLDHMLHLDTVNLNKNNISEIKNLSCLPHLKNLQINNNKLRTSLDIEHLAKCLSLSAVDLSHNLIEDSSVLDIFAAMHSLRVLNMIGNPFLKHMKNYRKNFIVGIKNLCYLDDRPVTDVERACVTAWSKGGIEAERLERIRWKEMEQEKIQRSVDAVLALRNRKSCLVTSAQLKNSPKQESNETEDIPLLETPPEFHKATHIQLLHSDTETENNKINNETIQNRSDVKLIDSTETSNRTPTSNYSKLLNIREFKPLIIEQSTEPSISGTYIRTQEALNGSNSLNTEIKTIKELKASITEQTTKSSTTEVNNRTQEVLNDSNSLNTEIKAIKELKTSITEQTTESSTTEVNNRTQEALNDSNSLSTEIKTIKELTASIAEQTTKSSTTEVNNRIQATLNDSNSLNTEIKTIREFKPSIQENSPDSPQNPENAIEENSSTAVVKILTPEHKGEIFENKIATILKAKSKELDSHISIDASLEFDTSSEFEQSTSIDTSSEFDENVSTDTGSEFDQNIPFEIFSEVGQNIRNDTFVKLVQKISNDNCDLSVNDITSYEHDNFRQNTFDIDSFNESKSNIYTEERKQTYYQEKKNITKSLAFDSVDESTFDNKSKSHKMLCSFNNKNESVTPEIGISTESLDKNNSIEYASSHSMSKDSTTTGQPLETNKSNIINSNPVQDTIGKVSLEDYIKLQKLNVQIKENNSNVVEWKNVYKVQYGIDKKVASIKEDKGTDAATDLPDLSLNKCTYDKTESEIKLSGKKKDGKLMFKEDKMKDSNYLIEDDYGSFTDENYIISGMSYKSSDSIEAKAKIAEVSLSEQLPLLDNSASLCVKSNENVNKLETENLNSSTITEKFSSGLEEGITEHKQSSELQNFMSDLNNEGEVEVTEKLQDSTENIPNLSVENSLIPDANQKDCFKPSTELVEADFSLLHQLENDYILNEKQTVLNHSKTFNQEENCLATKTSFTYQKHSNVHKILDYTPLSDSIVNKFPPKSSLNSSTQKSQRFVKDACLLQNTDNFQGMGRETRNSFENNLEDDELEGSVTNFDKENFFSKEFLSVWNKNVPDCEEITLETESKNQHNSTDNYEDSEIEDSQFNDYENRLQEYLNIKMSEEQANLDSYYEHFNTSDICCNQNLVNVSSVFYKDFEAVNLTDEQKEEKYRDTELFSQWEDTYDNTGIYGEAFPTMREQDPLNLVTSLDISDRENKTIQNRLQTSTKINDHNAFSKEFNDCFEFIGEDLNTLERHYETGRNSRAFNIEELCFCEENVGFKSILSDGNSRLQNYLSETSISGRTMGRQATKSQSTNKNSTGADLGNPRLKSPLSGTACQGGNLPFSSEERFCENQEEESRLTLPANDQKELFDPESSCLSALNCSIFGISSSTSFDHRVTPRIFDLGFKNNDSSEEEFGEEDEAILLDEQVKNMLVPAYKEKSKFETSNAVHNEQLFERRLISKRKDSHKDDNHKIAVEDLD
nr:dynein axonemal assembly factor 1 homolog [Parasteatoda tepidariorum]